MLRLCVLSVALIVSVPAVSSAQNSFARIKAGVGNCIFSTAPLGYQKEASYKGVKPEYGTGDVPIEMRCYMEKKLGQLVSLGAMYNQMRDDGDFNNYFTIQSIKSGKTHWQMLGRYTTDKTVLGWDQLRMKISSPNGRCNIKDRGDLGRNGCVDIDAQVKALAQKEGAALPYTASICMSIQLKWSDKYKVQISQDGRAVEAKRTRVNQKVLAQSCVKYTAR
jgi:hypothetical protein